MIIAKPRKIDRRVSRTRRLLRDALFALMLEKGFEAVTIEEITGRADLGRTTFYLHYRDKEDLLMESLSELVNDLIEQLASLPGPTARLNENGGEAYAAPAVRLAFEHVAQNADIYRLILRGEGTYSANQRVRELVSRAIASLFSTLEAREHVRFQPQVPMEIFLQFVAGSWMGLTSWWLENRLPLPAEQMAVLYQQMLMRGARQILGLEAAAP